MNEWFCVKSARENHTKNRKLKMHFVSLLVFFRTLRSAIVLYECTNKQRMYKMLAVIDMRIGEWEQQFDAAAVLAPTTMTWTMTMRATAAPGDNNPKLKHKLHQHLFPMTIKCTKSTHWFCQKLDCISVWCAPEVNGTLFWGRPKRFLFGWIRMCLREGGGWWNTNRLFSDD